MIIAVDFDGTCVTHNFPYVGEDIGAVPVLKKLASAGHKLILFTMRSHKRKGIANPDSLGWKNSDEISLETDVLQDAIDWFFQNGIPLWGINENPIQKNWTASPKPYAQIYIDDVALGCPLIVPDDHYKRPYVDWKEIERLLIKNNII